jgi:hypothetical protein
MQVKLKLVRREAVEILSYGESERQKCRANGHVKTLSASVMKPNGEHCISFSNPFWIVISCIWTHPLTLSYFQRINCESGAVRPWTSNPTCRMSLNNWWDLNTVTTVYPVVFIICKRQHWVEHILCKTTRHVLSRYSFPSCASMISLLSILDYEQRPMPILVFPETA